MKIKSYEDALEKGYIGIRDYTRRANIGLSIDMMKKIVAVFNLQARVIHTDLEVTRVFSKSRLEYMLKEFYPTITKRTKTWYNSSLVTGDFRCDKKKYKKYLDGLENA